MIPFTQPALKAASQVLICRVIKQTAAATGDEATAATDIPVGISSSFTKYPPGTAADSGQCADTGDPLPYIGRGRVALAFVGAGGVTGGTRVEAGAAGAVVSVGAAGTGKWTVGVPLDSAPASSYVDVFVDPQPNV